MLRFFVLALLLLNGIYFAWSHSLLLGLGLGPVQQSEPEHLAKQIKPEALRLLSAQEARQEEAPPRVTPPPVCLQAGVFDEEQSGALRRALEAGWPAGSWVLDAVGEPAHWIVYMGKFANPDALAKKRAELASLNLKFEPLTNSSLGLGLSLGGFDTKAAAQAALEVLSRRGVRTARVVQEREEVRGTLLKLPAVDDALRARINDLKPALAGKTLSYCR
ncbi:MAG: SPOR domain-containing protein [Pseudomonadota bacterium]